MRLKRKVAFTCQGCAAGISRKDLRRGLAFKREGKIYCKECFTKKFPQECLNHPGQAADSVCAMCHNPLCSDCVIRIGEKVVCGRCKPLALARIERDEEIGPLDLSVAEEARAREERPPKYRMYDPIEDPPFFFAPSVVTVMAFASVMFCGVPFVILTDASDIVRALVFAACGIPAIMALIVRQKSVEYYEYEDALASGWLHMMTVAIVLSIVFSYINTFLILTGLDSVFKESPV
jgi:hypothetical protein